MNDCCIALILMLRPHLLKESPPMEACIDLGFETKENMLNAQKIFVSPLRIDGVFVHFMTMGRVVPE